MYYLSPYCGSYPAITEKDSSAIQNFLIRAFWGRHASANYSSGWMVANQISQLKLTRYLVLTGRNENFKTSLPRRMCGDMKLYPCRWAYLTIED